MERKPATRETDAELFCGSGSTDSEFTLAVNPRAPADSGEALIVKLTVLPAGRSPMGILKLFPDTAYALELLCAAVADCPSDRAAPTMTFRAAFAPAFVMLTW